MNKVKKRISKYKSSEIEILRNTPVPTTPPIINKQFRAAKQVHKDLINKLKEDPSLKSYIIDIK